MRVGYSFSVSGDYHSTRITVILERDREVAKGDLVYVKHPKNGLPVVYQITKAYSHKGTRDYEEALLKEGSVIRDEERTTVRAQAYQWGWLDGEAIRPLRYPLPPNTPIFKAEPKIIEEFTKPSSRWRIQLGVDPSSGLDVDLDLYYLIRQDCLICGAVGTGKCLPLDEVVLVNGELTTGKSLMEAVEFDERLLDDEVCFSRPFKVVSLNGAGKFEGRDAYLYLQRYQGPVIGVTTRGGRKVRCTPNHPLLVARKGKVSWIPAREVEKGDFMAVARRLPIGESAWLDRNRVIRDLRKRHMIITYQNYRELAEKTNNFKDLSKVGFKELEEIKSLVGVSRSKLLGAGNAATLSTACWRGRIPARYIQMYRDRLLGLRINPLKRDEVIIVGPGGIFHRYKFPRTLDEGVAEFLAFLHAEGYVSERELSVTQKKNIRLLSEFLRVAKEKFGLTFRKFGISYRHASRLFIRYLGRQFEVKPGRKSEQISTISPLILRAPKGVREKFISWFIALDGYVSRKGYIEIAQVNENYLNTLTYLLLSCGVVPRILWKKRKLTISGYENLKRVWEMGIPDREKQKRLTSYLRYHEKGTNVDLIPINVETVRRICYLLGVLREGEKRGTPKPCMKRRCWYSAYKAHRTGELPRRDTFIHILNDLRGEFGSARKLFRDAGLEEKISWFYIRQREIAEKLNISEAGVSYRLRQRTKLGDIEEAVNSTIKERIHEAEALLGQMEKLVSDHIIWDRVKEKTDLNYDGVIYDLHVPSYHNFVGGIGGIILHNTTTALSMIARAAQAEPPVKIFIVDKDGEYGSLERMFKEKVKKVPWFSFFRSDDIGVDDIISEFGWQRGWWASKILMKALSLLRNAGQPLIKRDLIEAVKSVFDKDVGFRKSDSDFDSYKKQVMEAIRFSRTIPSEHVEALDPVSLLNRHRIVIMDLSQGPNGWAQKHTVLTQVLTRIFYEALENSGFGCVVVLEEVMYYAPQWTQFSIGDKDSRARLLSIVKEIATNGGRNGIGLWVVTQRLATVDKTVITQCANNVISHALEDVDKKRLQEVVGEHFVDLLGSLPQGEAIVKGTALKCKFPVWVKVTPELKPASAAAPPMSRFETMALIEKQLAPEILV